MCAAVQVLRRLHDDPPEPWSQWVITATFSSITSALSAFMSAGHHIRVALGLEALAPSVVITATDPTGRPIPSGGKTTEGAATFKFTLSDRPSARFDATHITHNCASSKFLGMKTTYYLECSAAGGTAGTLGCPRACFVTSMLT